MKTIAQWLVPLTLAALSSTVSADPWKDESGHGRDGERREHKQEYWDGNCKVERKWEKGGEYKEERKCKAPKRHVRQDYRERQPVYYAPQPVYREPQRVVRERVYYPDDRVHAEPGVAIDVRIRQ